MLQKRWFVGVLFALALAFFLERGAYRALRESRTGDFATIYAAARCWMQHENPYSREDWRRELVESGAPAALIQEQERHASLYLIPALPFVAAIAWLPWTTANVAWCLISLGFFAASLWVLLRDLPVPASGKWVAASACLFFYPTCVGVLNGNPSVFSISLTILALYFAMRGRLRVSGLLFAVTLCVKPQIALCCLLALVLWRCWTAVWLGTVMAAVVSLGAVWYASVGGNWAWWDSLRANFATEAAPGGLVDPRPASPYAAELLNAQTLTYLVSGNARAAEGLVFLLLAGSVAFYSYRGKREGAPERWIDVAFFAAVTLALTYHRYYDGQLLLALVPAVVYLWLRGWVRTAVVLGGCFVLVGLPLQSVFARGMGAAATARSLEQLVLLRHEPLAVLVVALLLGTL